MGVLDLRVLRQLSTQWGSLTFGGLGLHQLLRASNPMGVQGLHQLSRASASSNDVCVVGVGGGLH